MQNLQTTYRVLLSRQGMSLDFIHRRRNLDGNKVFHFTPVFVKFHRHGSTKVPRCGQYRWRPAGNNVLVLLLYKNFCCLVCDWQTSFLIRILNSGYRFRSWIQHQFFHFFAKLWDRASWHFPANRQPGQSALCWFVISTVLIGWRWNDREYLDIAKTGC